MNASDLHSEAYDASPGSSTINPFDDVNDTNNTTKPPHEQDGLIDPAMILYVHKTANLTIAAESLVVLDEDLRNRRDTRNCFGLLARWTKTTQAIPFRNVLWAELDDNTVIITYARPVGRGGKSCKVDTIEYTLLAKTDQVRAKQWVSTLLHRAYPGIIKRQKRIKVLINPYGGQGYAHKIWTKDVQPILAAAHCHLDVEETKYQGHAVELAEALNVDAYDVVAAASGDGVPHEIFNGLSKQKRPRYALQKLAVAQIPCGSGNALCINTLGTSSPSWAAVEIVKGLPAPIDLMAVTQGKRQFYSFLSQAVGIVAESDLGTEGLRWMGFLRVQWGILVRMFGKTIYPAEISIATMSKDKEKIGQMHASGLLEEREAWRLRDVPSQKDLDSPLPPLAYGTVSDAMPASFETVDHPDLGNFYVGNMSTMAEDTVFFRAALLRDGLADAVTISGAIPRTRAVAMLTTIDGGGLIDFPEVDYRKVHAYRITPRMDPDAEGGRQTLRYKFTQWIGGAAGQTEGLIAIDGEKMPFAPFQVEVHQGLGTTLMRGDHLFTTNAG